MCACVCACMRARVHVHMIGGEHISVHACMGICLCLSV